MSVVEPENVPISNPFISAKASIFGHSSVDAYVLSIDDEEYLKPDSLSEMPPGRNGCAARLSIAARLYFNTPIEAPKNWGQVNPNLNDYHSNPMVISCTLLFLDITDWWLQQDQMHSHCTDLSKVAHSIFCIIPHGVGVEFGFYLRQDVIGWRQFKPTGEIVRE